jgi:hypothetical protein
MEKLVLVQSPWLALLEVVVPSYFSSVLERR